MSFESWLAECRSIISRVLNFSEATISRMIHGAGPSIYRDKFDAGLTPQQCVDDELVYWNE